MALEDGVWHHVDSYSSTRAHRPETVALWQKVKTAADEEWERRYLCIDPVEKAYGGVVKVILVDGTVIEDAIDCADAHPLGGKPFIFDDYVGKFRGLADGIVGDAEQSRFIELANRLALSLIHI